MSTSTRERTGAREQPGPPRAPRTRGGLQVPAWLDGPMTSSHLVLGSAGMLLVVGLVMVFSASSIEAALDDQPAWLPGVRQIVFAAIGVVGMVAAMRLPVSRIRQWSGRAMLVVFLLLVLVLVPGLGIKLNGSRAWFDLGVTNFQPSELGKLVFALWGAHVIALREKYLTTQSLLVPVLPVFVLMSLLLLAEPDMGAVVSLGLVVAGLMWAGGIGWRYVGWGVLGVAGLVWLMVAVAPYRMARLTSFIDPCSDAADGGYQACHGLYALATGGFWGVGLGNSAMKWNLLPHAESDYIFAIIGEELGFLGCLVVVVLYAILTYAGFRIARRATDRFIQLASVAITVWLIGQATMNMGYVVGLLPVTGVQLPLISAGGTSLVLTLFIVGLLARFARAEPAAIAHQRAQQRNPLLRLLLPVPTASVEPVPSRRRRSSTREAAPRTRARASARTVTRAPGRIRVDLEPTPQRRADGSPARRPNTVARLGGDRRDAADGRWAPTPDERRPGSQRQTVRGRPSAGDRSTDHPRRSPAAGSAPVRRPAGAGEPPGARVRTAPRSHLPRTERPGRPQ
ncbi:putative lipid II flippase FtsW [Modestobacter marinus]|uniref:putative lipid II flippase FtsW n=1 Tax=Modestobacter marinus TaxID=477641 RepID=UPI0027E21347|nr:putative lipid II flippase FtsW [Modestobacter marinus]